MVSVHDLDVRGVAAAGVPIAVLQPQGLAHPNARLRQQHPQQSVAHRSAPLPRVGVPTRARLTDPLDLHRRQDRWRRTAPLAHPDHRLPAALAAGDVFQQRLVPAAATMGDPMQVSAHIHAVEDVKVVTGDHRAQPRGDRRLGKPGPTTLDRGDLRPVPGAQPGQERPQVLQRHRIPVKPEQLQELPPQRQRPRVGLHRIRRNLLSP